MNDVLFMPAGNISPAQTTRPSQGVEASQDGGPPFKDILKEATGSVPDESEMVLIAETLAVPAAQVILLQDLLTHPSEEESPNGAGPPAASLDISNHEVAASLANPTAENLAEDDTITPTPPSPSAPADQLEAWRVEQAAGQRVQNPGGEQPPAAPAQEKGGKTSEQASVGPQNAPDPARPAPSGPSRWVPVQPENARSEDNPPEGAGLEGKTPAIAGSHAPPSRAEAGTAEPAAAGLPSEQAPVETDRENKTIQSAEKNQADQTLTLDGQGEAAAIPGLEITSGESAPSSLEVRPSILLSQVWDGIKGLKTSGQSSLQLQLHPEELGTIELQLTSGADGLQVVLHADLASTASVLQSHLPELHSALSEAGINLTGLSIGYGSQNSKPNGEQPGQSRGKNGHPFQRKSNFDSPVSDPALASGRHGWSQVDYRI